MPSVSRLDDSQNGKRKTAKAGVYPWLFDKTHQTKLGLVFRFTFRFELPFRFPF